MRAGNFRKIVIATLMLTPLSALAATPPAVQAEQSPTIPAPAGLGHGKGGKLAGFLTPQQRAMLLLDMRDQIKDVPQAQRQAFRKRQVQKLVSMSPADRQKFLADLQAKWDALPEKQKARLQQRLARQTGPQTPNAQ